MLELSAAIGKIDLKYALRNQVFVHGVNLVIRIISEANKNVSEQTGRRGRRLSIIGFLQPLISFVYGLVIGGVGRKSYIEMMEQEAAEAEESGRMRVIVQDNGPIHRCKEVSAIVVKVGKTRLIHFLST
jgi:putative transposase